MIDLYIGLINGMVNLATLIKASKETQKELRDFQKSEVKLKLY